MRKRWFSARAVLLHCTVIVVTSLCLAAAWWQIGRARGGNDVSFAYALQWPLFAVIAVVYWWHLIHDDKPEEIRARRTARTAAPGDEAPVALPPRRIEDEDEKLRKYNDYLQELAASGERKTWRRARQE